MWVGDRARYALKSLIVLRFVGRGTSALEGSLRSRDPGSGSKVGTPRCRIPGTGALVCDGMPIYELPLSGLSHFRL